MMNLSVRAYQLAERILAASLPQRWAHVQGVAHRARQAAPLFSITDGELLVSAGLLHDIGYAPALAQTGFHPIDGAIYLRTQGYENRLCALVAHHSCSHREAELRMLSAQLADWEDEQTDLRDALWWADMTTMPDGRPTNIHERIEEIRKRYGPENLVTFFIRHAEPDLVAAVERTEERLEAAGLNHTAK